VTAGPAPGQRTDVHVAFLRGVSVGANKLAMNDLVERNPFLRAGADPTLPRAMSPRSTRFAQRPMNSSCTTGTFTYVCPMAWPAVTNAYLDRILRTVGTTRNWRTMTRLCEAAES
jgi:hypothetical protein